MHELGYYGGNWRKGGIGFLPSIRNLTQTKRGTIKWKLFSILSTKETKKFAVSCQQTVLNLFYFMCTNLVNILPMYESSSLGSEGGFVAKEIMQVQ